jgi:hypothetical protein
MSEKDIQQTARFARELLVMSLIPWMEKCVIDWNENVSPSVLIYIMTFSVVLSFHPQEDYHPVCSHQLAVFSERHHHPLPLIILVTVFRTVLSGQILLVALQAPNQVEHYHPLNHGASLNLQLS